ncbi:MAG: hypothetical protein QNK04_00205 [Myxococcota bacterium]|nr:hypothetical protein [Myxococcota bacterium]
MTERGAALLLAGIAGSRVLIFSLAFPFFTNVDEYRHVDVVLKYSRGHLPAPGPDFYEPDLGWWVGSFGSPEYHREPGRAGEVAPPPWTQAPEVAAKRVAQQEAYLGSRHSLEADQPPLYYATAGAWLLAGRSLGLEGAVLLYWVRLLGAGVAAGCVLLSWLLLRDLYVGSALMRLGVPALLAFLPLDSLYYVTSDVLSPLVGGLAFLLVLRLAREPLGPPAAFALAGLVGAAGFLGKYPNAALGAAALFCSAVVLTLGAERRVWLRWLLFWAVFLLPPLLWLLRNQWLGGELTGTAFKVETLGWVRKPFFAWWDHPVFTPAGLLAFVRHLVPSFWRGELVWETRTLAWPAVDALYLVSTLLFLTLAALGLRRSERSFDARVAEGAALCAVLAGAGILIWLSLLFHFPERANPSASFPYFVEGRLVSGVLVPFALLYVRGIEVAASRLPEEWRARAAWGVLGAVLSVSAASEVVLSRPVFLSAYNAFHLP